MAKHPKRPAVTLGRSPDYKLAAACDQQGWYAALSVMATREDPAEVARLNEAIQALPRARLAREAIDAAPAHARPATR